MGRTAAAIPRLSADQVIDGRYRLDRPIGFGGMSEVWSGRHLGLDRPVALKFIRTDMGGVDVRLNAEARLLSTLRHPSIVEVYDLGVLVDGTPYLVMELLDGVSLHQYANDRGGRLPATVAARLASRLLEGLEAVHGKGVVHRDVKPENVLVVQAAGGLQPKLIDFGIALRTADPRLTAIGSIVGTPMSLAPEQVLGATADATTDLWAVGVMLYELITGEAPFVGRDMLALFRAILESPLAFPRHVPDLDGSLFSILSMALRKESALRYPSARAMREALDEWLRSQPPTDAHAPTRVAPTAPLRPSSPSVVRPEPRRTLDALIRANLRKA